MQGSPLAPGSNGTREAAIRGNPYLRIHAVNIFVRDQEQSLRFYVDQLGFDVAFDARIQSGDRWLAVAPPDGSALLALIAPNPKSRDYQMIGRPTGIVFVSDDVVVQYQKWRKKGVKFRYTPRLKRVNYESPLSPPAHTRPAAEEERHSIWGGVFTHFEDLDGNSFALVGFDEVTREIESNRRVVAEKLESEKRIAREFEIAKEVQARLFPQTLPPIRTLEYAGACIQARQVGGDYYDFMEFGDRRYGFVVGDIAGKGMAAALLMANLQANIRIQCAIRVDQERLLRSVNDVFRRNSAESSYATLFFADYSDETGNLRYTNCGHLPGLLLRRDGSVDRLESTGTVIGLFEEWDCEFRETDLVAGDTLAVYTDGITESCNKADEEFGEQRLVEALRFYSHLPAEEIVAAVMKDVQQFGAVEQHDDITLTVAKCR